ncbi:MAG: hypothetical protein WA851_25615, partial [Xanthobacteraceae bacterium]
LRPPFVPTPMRQRQQTRQDATYRSRKSVQTTGASSVATLSSIPLSKDAAERRQLMVMFCDLVGSIAMSACLDPGTCAASSGPSFHKPIARPAMSEYQ